MTAVILDIDDYKEPVRRMSRDLRKASATMTHREAEYLVRTYYDFQHLRIVSGNRLARASDAGAPHTVIDWMTMQMEDLEAAIKAAMDVYTMNHRIGRWMRSIVGVGPVIAAGLMSMIDIKKAPTVGKIYRYAGLDPTAKWDGKKAAEALVASMIGSRRDITIEDVATIAAAANRKAELVMDRMRDLESRRNSEGDEEEERDWLTRGTLTKVLSQAPHNPDLKTLCWKLGESFVKVSGNPRGFYGHVWAASKARITADNEAGKFADYAAKTLAERSIGRTTEAYKAYAAGKLPKGQIHARAKRMAVKLFLSHMHHRWHEIEFGCPPPSPYPIAHLGHTDFIEPPPMVD